MTVPPAIRFYNHLFHRKKAVPPPAQSAVEKKIQDYAAKRTDISDHLTTLFHEALSSRPNIIVELGTRGGASTFIFKKVAEHFQIPLISVDIDNCRELGSHPFWTFVHSDDIAFSEKYVDWCKEKQFPQSIDLLFIDTSHEYKHTVQEIKHWLPLVSENGKIIFHDTHLRLIYKRKDGSLGLGWDNQRGVIRAIEEYFETTFDETKDFQTSMNDFIIRHWAHCSGLTILDKVPKK
ncbi:class I SAM-dependent methyltransferase [bacterium]|nr:class I SAM-dependent methyltransferase [bacterium]